MLKKIWSLLFIVFGLFAMIIYNDIAYDAENVGFFGVNYDLSEFFWNSYIQYFVLKDEDPTYIWDDNNFYKYQQACDKNNENCLILPHQQTYASFLWLSSIQYVGRVLQSHQADYLYEMLDNITNLSPYFDYAYEFWQLIIPIWKEMEERVWEDMVRNSWEEAIKLGEKWKEFNCDQEKIEEIRNLQEEEFYQIVEGDTGRYQELKNPCRDYNIVYNLAFNYFHYLWDRESSATNYKIASFNEDSPDMAPSMVSIVAWRYGQHIQSMQLWVNRYITSLEKIESNQLSQSEYEMYEEQMMDSIERATFEFQLHILQEANSKVDAGDECFRDYNCLLEDWYIQSVLEDIVVECEWFTPEQMDIKNPEISHEEIISQSKCFILDFALYSGFIHYETWELIYPREEWFEFYWDWERFENWWIRLSN